MAAPVGVVAGQDPELEGPHGHILELELHPGGGGRGGPEQRGDSGQKEEGDR